jgi:hypothetical protein
MKGDKATWVNLNDAHWHQLFFFILTVLICQSSFAMEAVVPAEITSELTQILSNLVLGDNDIRSRYK